MDENFSTSLKKHSYIIVVYVTYLLYLVVDSEKFINIFYSKIERFKKDQVPSHYL